jgi:hypothetical protein
VRGFDTLYSHAVSRLDSVFVAKQNANTHAEALHQFPVSAAVMWQIEAVLLFALIPSVYLTI